jgi:hypothetical protein
MELDISHYCKEKKIGDHREGLCYYCGSSKHRLLECPIKLKGLKAQGVTSIEKWNIGKWGCPVTVGTMRLDATKSKEKGLFVSSDPTLCLLFSCTYQNVEL